MYAYISCSVCATDPFRLWLGCGLFAAFLVQLHMTCRFVNEYEEYKAASEEIAEKLRTEVQLLYEYTEKLTHIMERIECGMCARATKTDR